MRRRVHCTWTVVLAAALFASALAGCSPSAAPKAQTKGAGQGTELRATTLESSGVTVRQDIEQRLESIKGVQNVSVLMYNGDAYVGLTEIGTEKSHDLTAKGGDAWKGNPYGTQSHPKSAAGMTVQDMQRETINNAALHHGPYSTMSGDVDQRTYQTVVDAVKSISPTAQRVYVTGNIDQAQKLSGYKHFIQRGGNMAPHRNEFSRFLQTAFPQADRINMNTTNRPPSNELMRPKLNNGTVNSGR
ncbi:MAG: hypothetical protein WCC10_13415 [Tumebacillaceae bacterium]